LQTDHTSAEVFKCCTTVQWKTQCSVLDHTFLTTAQMYEQVAELSLTNPRDALRHDKRQNFETVTWPQPRPFCWSYVILLLLELI